VRFSHWCNLHSRLLGCLACWSLSWYSSNRQC
jgi:hypothetical protein